MDIAAIQLPRGLLDLTLRHGSSLAAARLAAMSGNLPRIRKTHSATLATASQQAPAQLESLTLSTTERGRRRRSYGPLAVHTGLGIDVTCLELEKRVEALQAAISEEETSATPPFYSEDDLMFFYEDLLAIPTKSFQPPVDRAASEQQLSEQSVDIMLEDTEGHPVVGHSEISIPTSTLSPKECESLIQTCIKKQDGTGALLTLELMKRSEKPIPENAITDILEILAKAGNVNATETLMTTFIPSPTERQRHLHVKAHIKSTRPNVIPVSALDVLHTYEAKGLFAPMQTYTLCIHTLFSSSSTISRAQAWDLFSHMRYVAHPNPDAWLYTLMIRACASPLTSSCSSEPEKALDFWTEMTVDKKIEPTVGAYNAVILACARSGEKVYVNEAYRLAKQMVDAFRDARGFSAFQPDKKTFIALLEGAKRIGDLARARWILAEMVRGVVTGMEVEGNREVSIDEEVMMHVFQAYAVYKPPFKREATVVVQDNPTNATEDTGSATSSHEVNTATSLDSGGFTSLALDSTPSFSHIPPQSHEEVLSEATFLFQRILHDTGVLSVPPEHQQRHEAGPSFSTNLANKFADVELTSRLLSSYISVFFRHAPLELTERMFWKLFDQLRVEKTARIYVEALERCAYSTKGNERGVAVRFSDDLWTKWKLLEDSGRDGERKLNARLIERAYAARLRLHAITDEVDKALQVVHSFAQRYPPSSIRRPSEKPYFRSTRTSLVGGSRPLVRMTSTMEVPDDGVPPLLTFGDLEVLHHRLVAHEMRKELGYLKWIAKAYEWMLRVRRDEAFRSKPVKSSESNCQVDLETS